MSFHDQKRPRAAVSLNGQPIAGESSDRPRRLGFVEAGISFFDQTIGKPIWWNGERWVMADGTPADDPPPAVTQPDAKPPADPAPTQAAVQAAPPAPPPEMPTPGRVMASIA